MNGTDPRPKQEAKQKQTLKRYGCLELERSFLRNLSTSLLENSFL
jgi:hypothetical protein